jgi:DNA-binding IclR family transcriptional regulator
MKNNLTLPHYAIASVNNAMRLLMLFQDREVLRVTDVSIALGVARSTAHRSPLTLAHQGFVQQERDSLWWSICCSPNPLGDIRKASRPAMIVLSRTLQKTVNLLALEDANVCFLHGVEYDRAVRVSARTGSGYPQVPPSVGNFFLPVCRPFMFARFWEQSFVGSPPRQ